VTYEPADLIEVFAWERRVGAVGLDPDTEWYAFAYDPEWVASGFELAPVHMPLRVEPYQFQDLRPETFGRLPPLLADSLPDAFGSALVNRELADQGILANQITPLDRLAYAADRAMGALEFRPPARLAGPDPATGVHLADLVLAARLTVSGQLAGEDAAHAALRQLIHVGTSAGGARAKALVSFNPQSYQVRSAYSSPAEGFEQWIIKLDGVSSTGMDGHGDGLDESAPYGRIEYAYSLMARDAGIEMTPTLLLAEGPRRHFMTKRFDRGPQGRRHHVISLCALAHLDYNLVATHSYDQYLQMIDALGLDGDQRGEAFRQMVFNVVAVNCDDHTKNFAFMRPEGSHWRLAPAFDITHAYRADSRWTSRHLMAVNGKYEDIGRADFFAVGERNDVPGYRKIVQEVQDVVSEWPNYAEQAGVDEASVKVIAADQERFRPR
jgi:serine/threonine-protein kinase HipA